MSQPNREAELGEAYQQYKEEKEKYNFKLTFEDWLMEQNEN